jgi:hypothetical protein
MGTRPQEHKTTGSPVGQIAPDVEAGAGASMPCTRRVCTQLTIPHGVPFSGSLSELAWRSSRPGMEGL